MLVQSKAHGHAEVLKCLVKSYNNITEGCQTEMSRAVRMALWEYKPQQALTGAPDDTLAIPSALQYAAASRCSFACGIPRVLLWHSTGQASICKPGCWGW